MWTCRQKPSLHSVCSALCTTTGRPHSEASNLRLRKHHEATQSISSPVLGVFTYFVLQGRVSSGWRCIHSPPPSCFFFLFLSCFRGHSSPSGTTRPALACTLCCTLRVVCYIHRSLTDFTISYRQQHRSDPHILVSPRATGMLASEHIAGELHHCLLLVIPGEAALPLYEHVVLFWEVAFC